MRVSPSFLHAHMLTCVRAVLLQVARVLASPLERERALGMQILSMILHLTEKESAQLASGLQVPTRARIPGEGSVALGLGGRYDSRPCPLDCTNGTSYTDCR